MASDETPYLIDANVCIGFINKDDSLHARATSALQELEKKGGTLVLFDHVIQEVLTVLLYSPKHALVESFVNEVLSDAAVFAIDSPIDWLKDATALAAKQNFKPKMSAVDWLLLSRSKTTGVPILTFDKQLLAASKKLC